MQSSSVVPTGGMIAMRKIAAEFVRLKVDIIVTSGGAAPAAKQATTAIPIVFLLAGDPVGTGLVARRLSRLLPSLPAQ